MPRTTSRRLLADCSSRASARIAPLMPPSTRPLAENHVIGGIWLANPGAREARRPSAWKARRFASWNRWAAVAIADVNHDGRRDVVLTVSEQHGDVAWLEAPRDPARGAWKRHTIGTGLDSVHSVDVTDMDGDGRPDVVLSEFRGAGRVAGEVGWEGACAREGLSGIRNKSYAAELAHTRD